MSNGFQTLDPEQQSLTTMREHPFKLHARLTGEEPHTTALIPRAATHLAKVDTGLVKERTLADAVVLTRARSISADRLLNEVMEDVGKEIHGGRKVDVMDPKHQDYFGGPVTIWEAKKGVLGKQLELMLAWPGKLKQDPSTGMQALYQRVADAVALGVQRRDEQKDAEAAQSKFDLYEKRELFAEYNGLAAETYGDLVAFAQAHPELRLPSDWTHSCFIHETRDPGPQTVDDVDALLVKARAEVAALETKRAELAKRDADAAQAEADAATAQADADAAKANEDQATKNREEADKKAREAAKKAKAAKKKKK